MAGGIPWSGCWQLIEPAHNDLWVAISLEVVMEDLADDHIPFCLHIGERGAALAAEHVR
jgi:hypothetical protein